MPHKYSGAVLTLLMLVIPSLSGCLHNGEVNAESPGNKQPKVTWIKDEKDGYFDGGLQADYLIEYSGGSLLDHLSEQCGCNVIMRYHGPNQIEGMKDSLSVHELIFRCRGEAPEEWSHKLHHALLDLELKQDNDRVVRPDPRVKVSSIEGQVSAVNIPENDPFFEAGTLFLKTRKENAGGVRYFFVLPASPVTRLTVLVPGGELEIDFLDLFMDPPAL